MVVDKTKNNLVDKHKVWLVAGIAVVIVAVAFLILYPMFKGEGAVAGQATGLTGDFAVKFYDGIGFKGEDYSFNCDVPHLKNNLLGVDNNDKINSMQVKNGYVAEIYRDANFKELAMKLVGTSVGITKVHDSISSIKVKGGSACKAELFKDAWNKNSIPDAIVTEDSGWLQKDSDAAGGLVYSLYGVKGTNCDIETTYKKTTGNKITSTVAKEDRKISVGKSIKEVSGPVLSAQVTGKDCVVKICPTSVVCDATSKGIVLAAGNHPNLQLNDKISAIVVKGGSNCYAELYQAGSFKNEFCTGTDAEIKICESSPAATVQGSSYNLNLGGEDGASSIKVVKRSSASKDVCFASAFAGEKYTGKMTELKLGQNKFDDAGTKSLLVKPGYNVKVGGDLTLVGENPILTISESNIKSVSITGPTDGNVCELQYGYYEGKPSSVFKIEVGSDLPKDFTNYIGKFILSDKICALGLYERKAGGNEEDLHLTITGKNNNLKAFDGPVITFIQVQKSDSTKQDVEQPPVEDIPPKPKVEICTNGIDDDTDKKIDCLDVDCANKDNFGNDNSVCSAKDWKNKFLLKEVGEESSLVLSTISGNLACEANQLKCSKVEFYNTLNKWMLSDVVDCNTILEDKLSTIHVKNNAFRAVCTVVAPPKVEDCTNKVDDDGDKNADCFDIDCANKDFFGANNPSCPANDWTNKYLLKEIGGEIFSLTIPQISGNLACEANQLKCSKVEYYVVSAQKWIPSLSNTSADCNTILKDKLSVASVKNNALRAVCVKIETLPTKDVSPEIKETLSPEITPLPEENCTDKKDNDGDGEVDCADYGCASKPGLNGICCQITSDCNVLSYNAECKNNVCVKVETIAEPPVIVTGDVDGDGKINVLDIVKIVNHITGTQSMTPTEKKAANTDCDALEPNVKDIIPLVNVITGKIKAIGSCPN